MIPHALHYTQKESTRIKLVLDLVHRNVGAMEGEKSEINIFLDLSNVFDCVDCKILFEKLIYLGLESNSWISFVIGSE